MTLAKHSQQTATIFNLLQPYKEPGTEPKDEEKKTLGYRKQKINETCVQNKTMTDTHSATIAAMQSCGRSSVLWRRRHSCDSNENTKRKISDLQQ